nr:MULTISPECIES: hypothetical protein [unclassified Phyllobacterium]
MQHYRTHKPPEIKETDPGRLHRMRVDWLNAADGDVFALACIYPSGCHIPEHHHSQSQLLHALTGVAMVTTKFGRWMVPPHHARRRARAMRSTCSAKCRCTRSMPGRKRSRG